MSDARPPEDAPTLSFEEARERLRARGYLDRGVEGAVLKGAMAARTRARAVVLGAATAALFLAAAFALAETALVAAASWLTPRDAAVLFLWIFAAALVVASVSVLALVLAAWVRTRRGRNPESAAGELGVAFGALAGLAGALAARPALETSGTPGVLAVAAAVALSITIAARVARGVTLAVLVAEGRSVFAARPRHGALAGAALLVLVAAAAFLLRARALPPDEPLVVEANARRAVVVGVDGWSDAYLPAGTAAPKSGSAYVKRDVDPAAFWTTVATGEAARRHGIGSLDLVRLRGVSSPVTPTGGSALYVSRVLPALGLARRESVTAEARRVPAMWEVARRAGVASLVVNWWTTYPAGSGGGTILGNHLYFAARAGSSLAGEGWPDDAARRAAALVAKAAPPPSPVERLVADAAAIDAWALAAFAEASARDEPRLALLYLPGLDILGAALAEEGRSPAERVRLAGALTEEAGRIATVLGSGALGRGADLLVVLLDGGRHERAGRAIVSGPLASTATVRDLSPEDVAPTVLAALGVPASRATAGRLRPELLAPSVANARTVASWGSRPREKRPDIDPREYVENLKSLGYLK